MFAEFFESDLLLICVLHQICLLICVLHQICLLKFEDVNPICCFIPFPENVFFCVLCRNALCFFADFLVFFAMQ